MWDGCRLCNYCKTLMGKEGVTGGSTDRYRCSPKPLYEKPCSFTELLVINVPQKAENCYYLLLGSFLKLLPTPAFSGKDLG